MEPFSGLTLQKIIDENQIDLLNRLKIGVKLCEILTYVHNRSFCHRDLNPDNILWIPDRGELKIIDFGLAMEFPRMPEQ